MADPCAGVPDPVNERMRPGKCFNAGARIAIDGFGLTPNEQVGIWSFVMEGVRSKQKAIAYFRVQ